MSDIVVRIKQFIDFKNLNISSFERSVGLSHNSFGRSLKNNGAIGSDKVEKIYKFFPELNPVWLLTGKGSMLIEPTTEKKEDNKAASESGVTHSETQEADMNKYVEKLEDENSYLRAQNEKLMQMLEAKDRMLEAKEERAAQNDYQGKLQELLARVMEIPATRPNFLKHLSKLEENQERMSEKIENIVKQVNYVEKKTDYRPTGSDPN